MGAAKKGTVKNLRRGRAKPPAGVLPGAYHDVSGVAELPPPPSPPDPVPPVSPSTALVQAIFEARDRKREKVTTADLAGEMRLRLQTALDDVKSQYQKDAEAVRALYTPELSEIRLAVDAPWPLDDKCQAPRSRLINKVDGMEAFISQDHAAGLEYKISQISDAHVRGKTTEPYLRGRIEGLRDFKVVVEREMEEIHSTLALLAAQKENLQPAPTKRIRSLEEQGGEPLQERCIT